MKQVLHMVETTEEQHADRVILQNKATNAGVYVTFWDGENYAHVYTWIKMLGTAISPILVGMEIINRNEPEFNQFFVWKEVKLGVNHEEVK